MVVDAAGDAVPQQNRDQPGGAAGVGSPDANYRVLFAA